MQKSWSWQPCFFFPLCTIIDSPVYSVVPLSSLANVTDSEPIKDLLKPFTDDTTLDSTSDIFAPVLPFKHAPRYARLTERVIEMVEDYALVDFHFLTIKEPSTFASLLAAADKANGYVFSTQAALHSQRSLFAVPSADEEDEMEEDDSWRAGVDTDSLFVLLHQFIDSLTSCSLFSHSIYSLEEKYTRAYPDSFTETPSKKG